MSKVLIINLTRIPQQVDVRHSDGTLDNVRLMPRSRVELREGMNVDTRWLQKNQGAIRIENPVTVAVQTTIMPTIPAVATTSTQEA